MNQKILVVLKYRESSGGSYSHCWSEQDKAHVGAKRELSSGLLNSAKFIVDMLTQERVDIKLVQVKDNNSIDKVVSEYQPDIVVIEALWVVPEKFDVLQRLHPNVTWIVRGHSEIPFLAQEGVALDWVSRYVDYDNIKFAANSKNSVRDLRTIIKAKHPDWSCGKVADKVPYLPNYYPYNKRVHSSKREDGYLHVGCFGAIRPLKNQLIQAVAAIEYATILGKKMKFHTNASRVETQGDSVLKNLEALFEGTPHEIVKHPWMPHEEFIKLVQTMDISLCVSFSETFCIVAADSIVSNVPLVGSPEIRFLSSWVQADPTDSNDIVLKMLKATDWRVRKALKVLNIRGLRRYCEDSKKIWLEYLDKIS